MQLSLRASFPTSPEIFILQFSFGVSAACFSLAIAMAAPGLAQIEPGNLASARVSAGACEMPQPMRATVGLNWYSDSRSSIVDPVLRAQHDEMEKPINTFMDLVVAPIDDAVLGKTDSDALSCADRNLDNWAKADGLTEKPTNNAALADQTIAVFGLNVMALKRREAGIPVSREVEDWLNDITRELVAIYTQGGPRNNMYVWSGAAAAASNLLRHDRMLDRHANRVWRTATARIDSKGRVASELGRGQRALVYHQYFNAALGALNLARQATGHSAGADGRSAMSRLGKAVGDWACDSTPLQELTGVKQEEFSRWNRAMGYAFNGNYLSASWRRCVKNVSEFADPSYGGRFDLTAIAISSETLTQ